MPKKTDYDNDDDSNENNDNGMNGEDSEDELIKEIEFGMTEDKIDGWIDELKTLKEERGTIILPIDDKIQLKVNYDEELDMQ